MNAILLVLYAVAGVAYAVQFARRTFGTSRVATVLLVLAAFAHTFVIGMETMRVGHVPFASATSAISTFVWLLALSYLYVELTTGERAMGVFILPLLDRAAGDSRSEPDVGAAIGDAREPVVRRSRVVAAVRLRELRAGGRAGNHLRAAVQGDQGEASRVLLRAPAVVERARRNEPACGEDRLAVPDGRADHRRHLGVAAPAVGRSACVAMSLAIPKIFVAVLCWAVYSFELYAQRAIGWRGRRAAWLSAVGFGIVLLNFVPVSYFFTTSHNF